ncbi:MAG: adenylyltransferase/cytidyltransferase family protein [Nanoarchaeota archaeon]
MGFTVVASGYFDPLHKGHLEYLQEAKKLGDKLIVIVNNDAQAALKKGKSFIPQDQRVAIVKSLNFVDEVFLSIDTDASVCNSLAVLRPNIFAKGGDRSAGEIPEAQICRDLEIKIVDGLGAKIESSSRLIARVSKNDLVEKPWGSYLDFIREKDSVVKEITVFPGKRLSLQSHNKRQEYWIVFQGNGSAIIGDKEIELSKGSFVFVDVGKAHRIINNSLDVLRIVEVQIGDCIEEDIIHYEDDFGRA